MRDPWLPIAFMLIVLIAVWLGILGPLPNGIAAWIHHWQTLIAALFAVTAALLAAYIAFQNTSRSLRHAQELESNRRKRKHAAVRALLPLALAQVDAYAEQSARALDVLIGVCVKEVLPPMAAPEEIIEPLPSETLGAFAEFIEYSDNVSVNLVESIVASIQVHDSRSRGLFRDNHDPEETNQVLRNEIEGLIIDAASIYAGIAALYDYARRREADPPDTITWDNVRSALRNMRFHDEDEDNRRLLQNLARREALSSGPFNQITIKELLSMPVDELPD